jgi:hypothetical protein
MLQKASGVDFRKIDCSRKDEYVSIWLRIHEKITNFRPAQKSILCNTIVVYSTTYFCQNVLTFLHQYAMINTVD